MRTRRKHRSLLLRTGLFLGLLCIAAFLSPPLQSFAREYKAAAAASDNNNNNNYHPHSSSSNNDFSVAGRALMSSDVGSGDGGNSTSSQCRVDVHGATAVFVGVGFVVIILYSFLGLAIICDDYFVASLDSISAALHLSEDVAGATFMAAGSSAPELFTSVADALFTKSDIGSGTIAGSAVFNLVVIPGLSAAMGGKPLDLDWRPMARDAGFYLLSIILWTIFITTGNEVTWLEALILLLTYAAYITYMKFNHQILRRFCPRPYDDDNAAGDRAMDSLAEGTAPAHRDSMTRRLSVSNLIQRLSQEESAAEGERRRSTQQLEMQAGGGGGDESAGPHDDATKDTADDSAAPAPVEEDKWKCPTGIKAQLLWFFSLPYLAIFTITVPDVTKPRWEKWYPIAFLSSVVWIGLLTWVMVTLANEIGCFAGIDPALMGIVLLAAGTSVPDTIASVIVAKDGKGDMAVSNAIGSNVFDILLGLGFPWLLSTIVFNQPVPVNLKREGQAVSTVAFAVSQLVIILILTLLLIGCNKFRLTPRLGYCLFAIYFIYLIINVLKQLLDK